MELAEAILLGAVLWLKLGAEAIGALLVGCGIVVGVYRLVRLGEVPRRPCAADDGIGRSVYGRPTMNN